jgi:hypothetical protein
MLRSDADAPKPPAYPFIYQSVSKSDRQTKNVRSARTLAYPFAPCLQIFRKVPATFAFGSFRHRRVSASVEGYLRRLRGARKREKRDLRKNFAVIGNYRKIWGLAQETAQVAPYWGKNLAVMARRSALRRQPDAAGRAAAAGATREGPAKGRRRSALPRSRLSREARNEGFPPESPGRPAGAAAPRRPGPSA